MYPDYLAHNAYVITPCAAKTVVTGHSVNDYSACRELMPLKSNVFQWWKIIICCKISDNPFRFLLANHTSSLSPQSLYLFTTSKKLWWHCFVQLCNPLREYRWRDNHPQSNMIIVFHGVDIIGSYSVVLQFSFSFHLIYAVKHEWRIAP